MAYLQLPRHCKFAGSQNDSACFPDMLTSLVEIYAKKALSSDADLTGSAEKI